MKKVVMMLMVFIFLSNISFAQDTSTKTKMFGVNPLGLIFDIYSGHYGLITNDGANELNFPFFFWKPLDELTMLGGGIKYRIYKDGNGKGIFYAGTVNVMSINWDYETVTLDENWNYTTETETVTGVSFTPGAEIGYRWAWDNGFTLAPTIGAGFTIGKIESSTGVEVSYGGQGISWSLGLGLAYMW